jgi:hypothetical protein
VHIFLNLTSLHTTKWAKVACQSNQGHLKGFLPYGLCGYNMFYFVNWGTSPSGIWNFQALFITLGNVPVRLTRVS